MCCLDVDGVNSVARLCMFCISSIEFNNEIVYAKYHWFKVLQQSCALVLSTDSIKINVKIA